jgi:hypothetical protein
VTDERSKSKLAKTAAVCAAGLGISVGLCGANFVLYGVTERTMGNLSGILIVTGWIELLGIVSFAFALLSVGIVAGLRAVHQAVISKSRKTD